MIFRRIAFALAAFWLAAALPVALPIVGSTPAIAQFADQANVVTSVGGTANAQTGTVANVSSYNDVLNVLLKYTPTATNTGDTTFTLNGFGTSPNFRKTTTGGLAVLTGNELVNGVPTLIQYDGTYFVIMSASTATLPSLIPQGYLTPCKLATPVSGCTAGQLLPTGDVAAATNLYYEPAFGQGIPIWNGSNFVNFTFSEMTLAIPSSRLANTIYDVCVFSNAGTPTIAFSVAWTTSTAGSGARGTGAGSAEITQTQGVWTNAVVINGVNGATTYSSIPANQCTMVGTVLIDGTNGQVSFSTAFGQNRRWAAWNFYNKQNLYLIAGDSTASWTDLTVGTVRPSNNNAANRATIVVGLPLEMVNATFLQNFAANNGSQFAIGFGIDGTTNAFASAPATITNGLSSSSNTMYTEYLKPRFIGQTTINSLEQLVSGSGATLSGTNASTQLALKWRG